MPKLNRSQLFNILYHYGVRNIPIFGVNVSTMHAYIRSVQLSAVNYDIRLLDNQWTIYYPSGGLFQFLVFSLMSFFVKDKNVKIVNRMTAVIGLVEGLSEPFQYFRLSGLGATIGILFAFLYLTYEIIR